MTTATQEGSNDVSFLDLPDDELGKYAHLALTGGGTAVDDGAAADEGAATAQPGADEDKAAAAQVTPPAGGEGDKAPPTDAAKTEEEDKPQAGSDKDAAAAAKTQEAKPDAAPAAKAAAEEDPAKADEQKEEKKDPPAVDYEAEYKKLMAPFKANGRDIAVQSVDEAIALMQMGANYNKKMAALKPNLALLKLLENNGLLSEEKISYLIDLDKKDPGAINKLIQESGIDPMDLDAKKAGDYKPTPRKVDTRELELDAVLDEIQGTPSYARTLEIVSKSWDEASKQHIADAPQLLKVINGHVQAGIYDLISAEVERERVFGRLSGLSDIEAYRQVGDAMHARGAFANLGRQAPTPSTAQTVVVPTPKKAEDDAALNDKRRAAAPAKPSAPAPAPAADFNPLAMSDDDFAKLVNKRLL